jgi:hypothetical protein
LLVAIGGGIGIGAAVAPTKPAKAATTAKTLVGKAVSAATGQKTYHYVQLSTQTGAEFSIIGDATPTGGRQVITQKQASGTGYDVYDLRLVNGTVYFRGNATADVDVLGVSATTTAPLAGKWVKVVKGNSPYKKMADGITTMSNISQIKTTFVADRSESMPGSKPATTRIVGGLYAGKGKKAVGSATLVVQTASSLPQSLNGLLTGGTTGRLRITWTFTHFGEKIAVKAPTGAVAFSSLSTHPTQTTATAKTPTAKTAVTPTSKAKGSKSKTSSKSKGSGKS